MKIKTSVINDSLEEVRYFNNQRKKLFVLIFALIGAFIFGIISQKFHIIGKMLLNIQAQYNTVNERIRNAPVFSKLTQIDLQIGYVNFQKICYQRELALNMGRTYRVHSFNEGDVGAKIRAGDNFVPVKVSLKGGQPEHWADPQKWSFKIDVKSDTTIMGMKKFALQSPSARMFINDWVCHKLLRFAGLIGIRFDFIRFSLNGDDYGLYVIEENMGKELIEYNKRQGALRQKPYYHLSLHFGKLQEASKPVQIDFSAHCHS
ncbi:MAG TPA: CotH kinase family protein [Chitinispirillaceae bacterium]|nr:CotH kinase family protein [Chitinispirillaceae bacterium]